MPCYKCVIIRSNACTSKATVDIVQIQGLASMSVDFPSGSCGAINTFKQKIRTSSTITQHISHATITYLSCTNLLDR